MFKDKLLSPLTSLTASPFGPLIPVIGSCFLLGTLAKGSVDSFSSILPPPPPFRVSSNHDLSTSVIYPGPCSHSASFTTNVFCAHPKASPTGITVCSSHYRQNHPFQMISTTVSCSEPSDGCPSLSKRNPEAPPAALRSYVVSLTSAWQTSFPLLFLWFFSTECSSHAVECTDLKHTALLNFTCVYTQVAATQIKAWNKSLIFSIQLTLRLYPP